MAEIIEEKKNKWGCKCCNENDPQCKCFHHNFTGHGVLKKILILVILGIIFMLGVCVGKLSTYHELGIERGYNFMHNRYDRDSFRYGPSYYPYGQNGYYGVMPMMNNPIYWQNNQNNATSTQTAK